MEERKRKCSLVLNWDELLPEKDDRDEPPPELERVPYEVEIVPDDSLKTVSDDELKARISRMKSIASSGVNNVPDRGLRLRNKLKALEAELKRRSKLPKTPLPAKSAYAMLFSPPDRPANAYLSTAPSQTQPAMRNNVVELGYSHYLVQPYYTKPIIFFNPRRHTQVMIEVIEEAENVQYGHQVQTQIQLLPMSNGRVQHRNCTQHLKCHAQAIHGQNGEGKSHFPMKILALNARGAEELSFETGLQELLTEHKPIVVIIMDTRMGVDASLAKIKSFHLDGHYAVAPVGYIGGFWVAWQSKLVTVNVVRGTLRTVHLELTFEENGPGHLLSTIYQWPQTHKQDQEDGATNGTQKDSPGNLEKDPIIL